MTSPAPHPPPPPTTPHTPHSPSVAAGPSNPLTADQVRRAFIDYFVKQHAHRFVPSSPCVPVDDPTLLFTNAGMNQFKPIFLGQADPKSELGRIAEAGRAVNTQKCIRAGGKHNDLDDVGKDTYHHTFFEMLGNWSFGDYFKKEAIAWSFDLLTRVYGIDPDRLYATYFGGNLDLGLEPDEETKQLWLKFLPPSHVLPGNMKDNFWEMGETGPCGPCTEIHYDRIGGRDAARLVNTGDPDVIEIWNNVFIQFTREEGGKLRMLPSKHVDTGMGLERLVSVLQNKRSNYDTDLFAPLFAAIQKVTGFKQPYTGKLGAEDAGNVDTAYRVIADHIRTLTFAITDGAVPSNEGRGYVLRRILRRAVRYGRQVMGAKTGFFSELVPVVVETMSGAFPELKKNTQHIIGVLKEEEESFGRTLDRGLHLFLTACDRSYSEDIWAPASRVINQVATATSKIPSFWNGLGVENVERAWSRYALEERQQRAQSFLDQFRVRLNDASQVGATGGHNPTEISRSSESWIQQLQNILVSQATVKSDDAFKLYDTYGFPIDLTQQMAEERGLKVDLAGYERLMEEAKERSRAAGKEDGAEEMALDAEAIVRLKHMRIEATDDADKFAGRDSGGAVKAIFNGENFDESARPGGLHQIGIILGRTNFYAEMGGQTGDTGRILVTREARSGGEFGSGGEFKVESVRAFGGYILHVGRMVRGELRVGDDVQLIIDKARRQPIQSNHTATHLLNFALRKVLGEHVDQKGSLVAPDRLRFDFSNNGPVTAGQLAKAEEIVRRQIAQDLTVYADLAPLYVAKSIAGLRAVFGEAYPDPVRVVSIGVPVQDLLDNPENPAWTEASVEFCGGTHVGSTKEAGEFAIVSEEAVAKGIRRVVALTGVAARAAIQSADNLTARIKIASALSGEALQREVADLLKDMESMTLPVSAKDEIRRGITQLQERLKAGQKEVAAQAKQQAAALARQIAESALTAGDRVIVTTIALGSDRGALEQAVKTIRDKCPKAAVMLFSLDESDAGRVSIMSSVPDELVKAGLNAGEWLREAAAIMGGKGGGRPDAAQGSGSDMGKLKDAIAAARLAANKKMH